VKKTGKLLAVFLTVFILTGTIAEAADTKEDAPVDMTATGIVLTDAEREGKTAEEIYALEAANEETATQNAYNMAISSNGLTGWPQGPATYGEAAIVMEAESGAILYAKNIDGKGYPASITKVLTALIALENGGLNDKITITQSCIDFLEYGDAHIGMTTGEEITLNDALHALLLASANEVAYAIGDNTGEGYEWFINQMNARAKELGALNSNFVNTNGLNDENHYTTARDMALITRELYTKHEEFKTISQTLQYTIPPTNLQPESRIFQQKHKMFYESNEYYYPYVTAGKTGYTEQAMNTLVTCADDGNMKLICVVLKTHGRNVYTDTKALLEYGFANFHKVNVKENEKSKDFKEIDSNSYVVLPESVTFADLKPEIITESSQAKTGIVNYSYEGNTLGSANVTFSQAYLKKNAPQVEVKETKKTTEKGISLPTWVKWLAIGVVVVFFLLFLWFCFALYVRKKRKEQRKKRQKRRRRRR